MLIFIHYSFLYSFPSFPYPVIIFFCFSSFHSSSPHGVLWRLLRAFCKKQLIHHLIFKGVKCLFHYMYYHNCHWASLLQRYQVHHWGETHREKINNFAAHWLVTITTTGTQLSASTLEDVSEYRWDSVSERLSLEALPLTVFPPEAVV